MEFKITVALLVIILALGCTAADFDDFVSIYDWADKPDFMERYHAAVYDNISLPTIPEGCHEINSTQSRSIPPTYLVQNITADKQVGSNWTMIDDNIRAIIIDYHFGGKEWKYITIDGATCHEIECDFEGAYCLECEGLNGSD